MKKRKIRIYIDLERYKKLIRRPQFYSIKDILDFCEEKSNKIIYK